MSKLNCPLLKTKAANQASKNMQSKKLVLVATLLSLGFGFGVSLSIESSVIAAFAHKETELVAIHAIADAIQAEKTAAAVAVADETTSGTVAAL